MTTCKNCSTEFEGNFCYQCGQSAETHPMNFHFLWHDIQHGLFHFDKGALYTIKALFTRPGHVIREYIEGKRINFFKPISLIILLASLYAFISLYFDVKLSNGIEFSNDPKQLAAEAKFTNWLNAHYLAYMLLTLPFWAIGSYISFLKQRYNFIEHFVLNAYVIVQMLVIQILLFPVTYYYNNTPKVALIIMISSLLSILISIWTYSEFFNKLSKIKTILYTLLSYTIMLTVLSIVAVVGGILLAIFKVI